MVIISYRTIREFYQIHPASKKVLSEWFEETERADWANFHEAKQTFNSLDAVGNDRYVFNIGGNKYRLIALINFRVRTLYVLFVGTHQEYNCINASTIKFKRKH